MRYMRITHNDVISGANKIEAIHESDACDRKGKLPSNFSFKLSTFYLASILT